MLVPDHRSLGQPCRHKPLWAPLWQRLCSLVVAPNYLKWIVTQSVVSCQRLSISTCRGTRMQVRLKGVPPLSVAGSNRKAAAHAGADLGVGAVPAAPRRQSTTSALSTWGSWCLPGTRASRRAARRAARPALGSWERPRAVPRGDSALRRARRAPGRRACVPRPTSAPHGRAGFSYSTVRCLDRSSFSQSSDGRMR